MMLKLSKAEEATLDTHLTALADAYAALGDAVQQFNALMETAWADVQAAQDAFNEVNTEWNTWRWEVGADGRGYFDERSAKWQESDKGTAYEAWIEPYEDETTFPQSELSMPEPVEIEVEDPADEMTRFGTEPET
jgi:hypothetical protein